MGRYNWSFSIVILSKIYLLKHSERFRIVRNILLYLRIKFIEPQNQKPKMEKEKITTVKKSTLVRLTPDELQKMESIMESENRSFSFLVSSIVKDYLNNLKPQNPKNK